MMLFMTVVVVLVVEGIMMIFVDDAVHHILGCQADHINIGSFLGLKYFLNVVLKIISELI